MLFRPNTKYIATAGTKKVLQFREKIAFSTLSQIAFPFIRVYEALTFRYVNSISFPHFSRIDPNKIYILFEYDLILLYKSVKYLLIPDVAM